MTIAFLPIDIEVTLPDEGKVHDYINKYQIKTKHSTWKVAPLIGRIKPEDWYKDKKVYIDATYKRMDLTVQEPPQYANNVDQLIPELAAMLQKLPYKLLTFAILLEQVEEVTQHVDAQKKDVITDPTEVSLSLEPRRYNFLLTRHSEQSFYVCEKYNSEKVYPIISKENPCFAFCEKYHLHGADYIGPGKVMILTGGILDREKHKETLARSLEKFKDQAIIFPDPVDEIEIIGSGIE